MALPEPNCGCGTPATDGGTAGGPMAIGSASGPTGTGTGAVLLPVGGKVGGGGTPTVGGGRIGVKAGK